MIAELLQSIPSLPIKKDVFPNDPMNQGPPFYEQTGASALRVILTALLARSGYFGAQPVKSILDLGCGYGRVTRWLKAAFPGASINVADLNRSAAEWCAETFNVTVPDPALTPDKYDLIFLGSVFTHLPEHKTLALIESLHTSLRDNGVVVFTALGRYGALHAEINPDARVHKQIGRQELADAIAGFHATGYGFAPSERDPEYGNAWAAPRWFDEKLRGRHDLVQIMLQEKGWNSYQDAYAYLKAPLSEARKSRNGV